MRKSAKYIFAHNYLAVSIFASKMLNKWNLICKSDYNLNYHYEFSHDASRLELISKT